MATDIDFSIIEEVANDEKALLSSEMALARPDLAEMELAALETGRDDYRSRRDRIKIKELELRLQYVRQEIDLRKSFSGSILTYLWTFSSFCAFVILLSGFQETRFQINTTVLTTLVGGTAASAFGLVSIVLSGIFRLPSKVKSKKSLKQAASLTVSKTARKSVLSMAYEKAGCVRKPRNFNMLDEN